MSDYLAQNEQDAILQARSLIASFNVEPKFSFQESHPLMPQLQLQLQQPQQMQQTQLQNWTGLGGEFEELGLGWKEPRYDPEELLGIVPADSKIAYDCREIMARILDDSRMHEFKPEYGSTIVTAFGSIHVSHPVPSWGFFLSLLPF